MRTYLPAKLLLSVIYLRECAHGYRAMHMAETIFIIQCFTTSSNQIHGRKPQRIAEGDQLCLKHNYIAKNASKKANMKMFKNCGKTYPKM